MWPSHCSQWLTTSGSKSNSPQLRILRRHRISPRHYAKERFHFAGRRERDQDPTAAVPDAVLTSIASVRRGGKVVLLGLPPTGQTVELAADLIVNNDLSVLASFGYTSAAWSRTVDLLNQGRIRPGQIVTHRFALEEHDRAFAALAAPEGRRGKILLEISRND